MAKQLKYDGSEEVLVKYALKDRHGKDIDVTNLVEVAEGKTTTWILS